MRPSVFQFLDYNVSPAHIEAKPLHRGKASDDKLLVDISFPAIKCPRPCSNIFLALKVYSIYLVEERIGLYLHLAPAEDLWGV